MTRSRIHASRVWLAGLFLIASSLSHGQVEQVVAAGVKRADEGAAAQDTIDKLSDQTDNLVNEYATVTKVVEGLEVYNGLLKKQVDNQISEMDTLRDSIDKVSLIERQIVPLMIRMIDSLEEFVNLDAPFLQEERTHRVERLQALMERSDVTAAEKFRNVLEAYEIENEYGRTIEAYKGELDVGGGTQQVDFLKIGRVALMYQSVGGDHTGVWDKTARDWQSLPPATYKAQVAKGLRMARKQVAPDLLILPVPAATEVSQ